ncbi:MULTISPECIES: hypothetical protein [unclassified Mesorhizobium]|uniref:plasmid mobilization protein n=1 Tax=unclassified Mesorhizobium TaxID=325217 RepID=UPI002417387F|nr:MULTISPECIES: hypothetical protein [unclassified Mesorhizobium]MDG4901420.1 hypothetical protein [Mesorhizobium sp. WSM4962]MDG4918908.1 hypothetical protein [Mesorhizobium sp. WSM4989]
MAGSGSEKRRRRHVRKARFTDEEAALFDEQAQRAGVSDAELIRYAVFGTPPLRASRQPAINEKIAAQLLGKMGQLASVLRACANAADPDEIDPRIEAAHRDIAEMRNVLFQALGREP